MGNKPDNPSADVVVSPAETEGEAQVTSKQAPEGPKRSFIEYWPLLAVGLLFVLVQWPVLSDWWKIWNETDSYYSHGPLVPLIAAFMVWTNRGKLFRTPVSHCWLGAALLLVFLPVHIIGLLMGLRVLYGVAFLMCLYGASLLLLGWRITRILFVPILFLITMMPVASWVLDNATGRYQLISATVATKFLQLTSAQEITQYGNTIASPGLPEPLLIGSPCSGLRLLISLITFSWFFIFVVHGAWWKKAILLSLSFPLSIFINSLRITMIGYVGFWTYSPSAMHKFHDYSGYIGLVLCFIILFGIAKLMRIGDLRTGGDDAKGGPSREHWPAPVGGAATGLVVIAVFAVAAAASGLMTPLYDLPKGKLDRASVPMSFGHWEGREIPVDQNTASILAKGDLLNLWYVDTMETGRGVNVFLDASLDVSAFHDPHLCLPGGGSPITQDRTIEIRFEKPRPITVKATVLEAMGDIGTSMVIHWYMLGEKSFPNTPQVVEANRANKLDDLRRVITNPTGLDELRNDIKSRQFTWYRFSTEALDDGQDEEFLTEFIKDFVGRLDSFGK